MRQRLAGTLAALLMLAAPACAQPCRSAACVQDFPADAGAVNVRDFGARGDGRTDDTTALLAAIAASGDDTGRQIWHDRLVFLPAGTYVVSGTLLKRYADGRFASGMILVGNGVDRTVIRLADHAPGFADPSRPRAVVMTTSKRIDSGGGRDYAGKGEGNDAYENFVENLTIDVGTGNPGAIAIDYLANNIGAVRDVLLRAPAGSGATGIAMLRKWPGPALIQRVAVRGFDVGIDIGNTEYGVTLSQIRLSGQRVAGLRNAGNVVSAEDVGIADGDGAALVNSMPGGLVMLTDSSLVSRDGRTLDNQGMLVLRDTDIPGGKMLVAAGTPERRVSGWVSGDGPWHDAAEAWHLPHPLAPVIAAGPMDRWAHVAAPQGNEDSTARLQAALRSGASTLVLQHGTYWISQGLEIPASIHRILGMNATIRVLADRRADFARTSGMLRVSESGGPLEIERLAFDNTDAGPQVAIAVGADRTVLLKDIVGAGVTTLDRQAGGGAAFVEDTCCGLMHVVGQRLVVARQFNSEGGGVRALNSGGNLSIIGLKTEGFCTAVQTEANGRTEVLGGLLYVVVPPTGPDRPAFVTHDAALAATFAEESLVASSHYRLYLAATQGGASRETSAASMPSRDLGRLVPLLLARVQP
jgi:hypothetical protein